ncbi:ATP-dependent helicase [Candidatus Phytoplasma pini]|uniref:DNA 3'-5' helicase n=1 Tax=Candidatus Phytoplasma pini TaxID=267362 RepID=A0A559KJY6_9MOLU|nr:ATP-dependent helicase [Candidatus Phytoplasma pini]TVY12441.1 ATP-dependent DNA helicase [Candidatus Phytoplasma pini]
MLDKKYFKKLNAEQLKAITYKGSLYVLSGAGTGKTTTLTTKIAYLIEELKIATQSILAITFTNNAVVEMKEYLKKFLNVSDLSCLTICTFHSLCYQILKSHIHLLNLNFSSSFSIIDESDQKKIIKEIIKKQNIDSDLFQISDLKHYISIRKIANEEKKIKEEFKSIDNELSFEKILQYNYHKIKIIYKNYQTILEENNLIDFDDLLIYAYQLLNNCPDVRNFYQKKFSHILVDEFQDIDLLQYQIIKKIGQTKEHEIFVVGDPNQNIYSFRGSKSFYSTLFQRDFQTPVYKLKQNYRSTVNILEKANLLISYNYQNQDDIFKNELQSYNKNIQQPVIYHNFSDSYLESKFVAKTIQKLMAQEQYKYNDFGILYRINALSQDIENQLILYGIPYRIKNATNFFSKKEIKDFISYLKILLEPEQDFYLKRILNVPKRQIGLKTINFLEDFAKENNISLLKAMQHISNSNSSNFKKKIDFFLTIFSKLQKIFNDSSKCYLSNVIYLIDDVIGYSRYLDKKKQNTEQKQEIENKKTLIQKLQDFFQQEELQTEGNFYEKLSFLLDKIILNIDNEEDKNHNQKVTLSTIHKTKGLEYCVVFAIGWENRIFSFDDTIENLFSDRNKDMEEERRLAYVAITRAKELLYISSAKKRNLFGKTLFSEPISFVQEMNLIPTSLKVRNLFVSNKISNFTHTNFYKIGDKVKHKLFNRGVVVSISKDIITIAFDKPYGIKKIFIKHPSLKKI